MRNKIVNTIIDCNSILSYDKIKGNNTFFDNVVNVVTIEEDTIEINIIIETNNK